MTTLFSPSRATGSDRLEAQVKTIRFFQAHQTTITA